jgi:hypothetical protein
MRICARSDCSSPAAAILAYDRTTQTAYLYAVDDPATRTPGDLCERHLSRFVVPRSWQLVDRRVGAAAPPAATAKARETDRAPTRRKWAAAGPSLFDTPVSDVVTTAVPVTPEAAPSDPVWMPRFGPDSELDDVLDAKTPLLRRAFGGG